MNLPIMLPTYWKPLAIIAAVALLLVGYLAWANHQQGVGEARATAACNAKIEQQKKEAAHLLAKETARVVTAERSLQDLKHQQEVTDARNKKTTDNLTARLRDLAGPAGRLRDPNAGRGGGGDTAVGAAAQGSGDCRDHGAEAGGLLSANLSGLLRRLAVEADEINNAYISCRADATAIRAVK